MSSIIDVIDRLPLRETMKVPLPWNSNVGIESLIEKKHLPIGVRLEVVLKIVGLVTVDEEFADAVGMTDRMHSELRGCIKRELFRDTLEFIREMRNFAYKNRDYEMLAKADEFERRIVTP